VVFSVLFSLLEIERMARRPTGGGEPIQDPSGVSIGIFGSLPILDRGQGRE